MEVKSYRDLLVWQAAMKLAVDCYRLTKRFPKEELFCLTMQIRKAAGSVPANIAEGWGRESTRLYIQFLRVAQGSLKELETHLLLAQAVELASEAQVAPLLDQSTALGKMLRSLIGSLQRKLNGTGRKGIGM